MRIVSKASPDRREGERVRYASGFACIRCGCTIYEYCALDGDATEVDTFLLCLACRRELNSMGAGMMPVLEVLRRSPLPRQREFDRTRLPYVQGHDIPDVAFVFGPMMHRTVMPILLANKSVLSLFPPEAYGGPVRMTVALGTDDGVPTPIVDANLWAPPDPGWRFERIGNRYTFESPDGSACLKLAFLPESVIRIEQLYCRFAQRSLEIDEHGARLDGQSVAIPDSSERLVGVQLA